MPISSDFNNPRNFFTKMTGLDELLPISIEMAKRNLRGVWNFTNPGVVNHNEILEMYKNYIQPDFKWTNFTLEEQAKILLCELLRCLKYVHCAKVLHQDLKPSNILINTVDWHLKIEDFGLARTPSETSPMTTEVVSLSNRVPELALALGCLNCTSAIDIWCAGCTLGDMLTGKSLFSGINPSQQLELMTEIASEGGRVCRPLVIADKGVSRIKLHHMRELLDGGCTFGDFLHAGLIEYLDVNVENKSLRTANQIASDGGRVCRPLVIADKGVPRIKLHHMRELLDGGCTFGDFSHEGLIEYLDINVENKSPRNANQCSMGKQVMGNIAYNQIVRFASISLLFLFPQRTPDVARFPHSHMTFPTLTYPRRIPRYIPVAVEPLSIDLAFPYHGIPHPQQNVANLDALFHLSLPIPLPLLMPVFRAFVEAKQAAQGANDEQGNVDIHQRLVVIENKLNRILGKLWSPYDDTVKCMLQKDLDRTSGHILHVLVPIGASSATFSLMTVGALALGYWKGYPYIELGQRYFQLGLKVVDRAKNGPFG